MKILVFAGNAREADNWAHDHGVTRNEHQYVRTPEYLRGRSTRDTPRVIIGTFHYRRDAGDLMRSLALSDLHGTNKQPDRTSRDRPACVCRRCPQIPA